LFTTLLAGFQALLHRHTGQDRILVGTPAAARTRPEWTTLVGYLANPLVLGADFSARPTFRELLARTRAGVSDALEHQDFPFPVLVDRLQPARDPSRSPLFQAAFWLLQTARPGQDALPAFALGEPGTTISLGALDLETLPLDTGASQFELSLAMAD